MCAIMARAQRSLNPALTTMLWTQFEQSQDLGKHVQMISSLPKSSLRNGKAPFAMHSHTVELETTAANMVHSAAGTSSRHPSKSPNLDQTRSRPNAQPMCFNGHDLMSQKHQKPRTAPSATGILIRDRDRCKQLTHAL